MNRRTFLQSLSAAMSMSMLGMKFSQQTQKIDYRLFTGGNQYGGRFDLESPFCVGDTVYATNGYVLVSHPGSMPVAEADRRVPNVSKLWWDEFESGGFRSINVARRVPAKFESWCESCYGVGRTGDYRECSCLMRDEDWVCIDCQDTEFTGGVKCGDCKGTGLSGEYYRYVIDGEPFNPHLIATIKTLGDLEVKILHEYESYEGEHTTHGVALFRGDNGIRGMLMGIAK